MSHSQQTERSGIRSSLGSQCCVLEQDWIGVNTFHDFDSGKQRSFYTFSNRGGGGGGGGAVADPEGVQVVRSNPLLN